MNVSRTFHRKFLPSRISDLYPGPHPLAPAAALLLALSGAVALLETWAKTRAVTTVGATTSAVAVAAELPEC